MHRYIENVAWPRALKCARFGGAIAAVALMAAVPAAALPTQSWNGYHWARTGPLTIELGNNLGAAWQPYLTAAASQWSAASQIDFIVRPGRTNPTACNPVYGGVQVCSGNYGATGWLGYANVWLATGFIVQATVRLNDYYFGQTRYNTDAWRAMTACQEIGHTLGLAHNNTIRTDLNKGTCMDYTNDPTGTAGGVNGTLANTAPAISDFLALDGIYFRLDTTQLPFTKPSYWAGDGLDVDGADHDFVAGIPEPGTWSLLIAGFGLIGAAMRRATRRRVSPASVRAI